MKIIRIVVLMLTLVGVSSYAQTYDSLSVDQMKSLYAQYEQGMRSSMKLSECDLVCGGLSDNRPMHVYNDKLLRGASVQIPASRYIWKYDTGEKPMLCWHSFLSEDADCDGKLKSSLVREFGTVMIDSVEVVPAKWYTGTLRGMTEPQSTCGIVFSGLFFDVVVKQGVWANGDRSGLRQISRGSLNRDVYQLKHGGANILDGPVDNKRDSWRLMYLLAHDVNRLCSHHEGLKADFTCLLAIDSEGKAHLHVLKSKEQNETQRQLLEELVKIIDQQPVDLFTGRFTIDGIIFPGLFVKASYEKGLWRFQELLDDNL